jgi:PGF-CTERM protein
MSALHNVLAVVATLALLVPAGVVGAAAPTPPSVDAGPAVDDAPRRSDATALTVERPTADRDVTRRDSRVPAPPFDLNVTAARVGNTTVEYTLRFDFDDRAGNVSYEPFSEYTLVEMEGLELRPPGYVRADGAETARLVLRADVTEMFFAVGTEAHLTTRAPGGDLAWTTADGARRSVQLDEAPYLDADWNATVVGPGAIALGGFVHFGPHERLDRRVDGRRITMIVPPDVGSRYDPAAKMAYLTAMARAFDVGGSSGSLVVFVVSEDRGPDRVVRSIPFGGAAYQSSFYVTESASNDTVAHEYVHTRQRFALNVSSQTRWLVEGSASYYERLYDWKVGDRSLTREVVPTFNVAQETGDAVLSTPSQWETGAVPYRKGSAVIAYLDQRIRAETDGERTFADVLRRLNERGGVRSNEELAAIVADVAGNESLADVVLRYSTTEAFPADEHDVVVIPADQRPPDATVVPSPTPTAADATGSANATTRETATQGDSGQTPGFGVGAGLAALLGLAVALGWRRRGRRR